VKRFVKRRSYLLGIVNGNESCELLQRRRIRNGNELLRRKREIEGEFELLRWRRIRNGGGLGTVEEFELVGC
ncbi:hypothetical protein A2U01_0065682, partial [Trifolium medium]|nr:hypothetical protein [Trifolium medium]